MIPIVRPKDFAMRGAAAELRARDPRAHAESHHGLEQAMGQNEHRHEDVFCDRRLMTEDVANGDPFRHRFVPGGLEWRRAKDRFAPRGDLRFVSSRPGLALARAIPDVQN